MSSTRCLVVLIMLLSLLSTVVILLNCIITCRLESSTKSGKGFSLFTVTCSKYRVNLYFLFGWGECTHYKCNVNINFDNCCCKYIYDICRSNVISVQFI